MVQILRVGSPNSVLLLEDEVRAATPSHDIGSIKSEEHSIPAALTSSLCFCKDSAHRGFQLRIFRSSWVKHILSLNCSQRAAAKLLCHSSHEVPHGTSCRWRRVGPFRGCCRLCTGIFAPQQTSCPAAWQGCSQTKEALDFTGNKTRFRKKK